MVIQTQIGESRKELVEGLFEPRGKVLTGETNEHNETNLLKGFLSQEEKYLLKKRTTQ